MSALSRDKQATMEKDAKELLKKAKGLTAPSLLELRFKPDWEAAAPLLDKAALLYKQLGNLPKALEAYERAAHAQERLGSQWHAAKHYEVMAELARKAPGAASLVAGARAGGKRGKGGKAKGRGGGAEGEEGEEEAEEEASEVGRYFKMAADLYMECDKATTAGECLTRAARILEDSHPNEAVRLYYDALDVYESAGKESYGVDAFRAAVAFLVRLERWADAVEVQMRFGAVSDKVGARHSQNKAYLGAVVTWLWAGDAEKAWLTFQDAMGVEAFAHTEEAFAADALFEAYRNNDEAGIASIVKSKQLFKHLDHQVARLATRLPNPASRVRRMARKLRKLMVNEEEGEEGEGFEDGGGGEDAGLL